MILVYTPHITSRFTYIVRFLLNDILGCRYTVTSSLVDFERWKEAKINYSHDVLDGVTIKPVSLLTEQGVHPFDVQVSKTDDLAILFPCDGGDLPFDVFAAAFYMLSRYEEYLSPVTDQHGRFQASSSLASRHGFLQVPVVDRWAMLLRDAITKKYPQESFPERVFRFLPTVDIDVAFAYLGRNIVRNIGAMAKALLRYDVADIVSRWKTWSGHLNDPFDTYHLFEQMHTGLPTGPVYFILAGAKGSHDKNLSPRNPLMQKLIRDIARKYSLGVHPSYASYLNPWKIQDEIKTLSDISGKQILLSRQHYLRLSLPKTYETLVKCGITEDYSMGFADDTGFRAGTCTPFHFYNVLREEEVGLTLFPFAVMDGTLNQYLQLTPHQALERISLLAGEVRKVQGTFISVWHNESLGGRGIWSNWAGVYTGLVKIAAQKPVIPY